MAFDLELAGSRPIGLPTYHQLYHDHDNWHLHYCHFRNHQALPYAGTSHSAVFLQVAEEGAARAALDALPMDMAVWAYNPARHQIIPGKRLEVLAKSAGNIPHSFWHLYAYTTQKFAGNRPWRHQFEKDGERLVITLATGMNSLYFDKAALLNCLLVTVRWTKPGASEQTIRFWLDEFINAKGALGRKQFNESFPNLVSVYRRLRGKLDSDCLLSLLAQEYADIVIGLRVRKNHHARYWDDDYKNGYPCRVLGGYENVLSDIAEELEKASGNVVPYRQATQALVDKFGYDHWALDTWSEFYGDCTKVVTAPCLPGCDGTLAVAEKMIAKHSRNNCVDRIVALARDLGYRCSCRFLAGQSLIGGYDIKHYNIVEDVDQLLADACRTALAWKPGTGAGK